MTRRELCERACERANAAPSITDAEAQAYLDDALEASLEDWIQRLTRDLGSREAAIDAIRYFMSLGRPDSPQA